MGLLEAFGKSVKSVMADQWLECIRCDAIADYALMEEGRNVARNGANKGGSYNYISSGSTVAVADGQAAIAVEEGEILSVWNEPGEHTFVREKEPRDGVFTGGVKNAVKEVGTRFTYGGESPHSCKVFFITTRELFGSETSSVLRIPVRLTDSRMQLDMDCIARIGFYYSCRITDPEGFYKKIAAGKGSTVFSHDIMKRVDAMVRSAMLAQVPAALNDLHPMKGTAGDVRISILPEFMPVIVARILDSVTVELKERFGMSLCTFGISELSLAGEDGRMIQQLQKSIVLTKADLAGANMVAGTADALRDVAQK